MPLDRPQSSQLLATRLGREAKKLSHLAEQHPQKEAFISAV